MDINIEQLIENDIQNKTNKTLRKQALVDYYNNPNCCQYCGKIIVVKENDHIYDVRRKKFCNEQCAFDYRRTNIKQKYLMTCKICGKKINPKNQSGLCSSCFKKKKDEEKIQKWKETGDTGCKVATTLRNCIRNYILDKQNHKCEICGIGDFWNGKNLHFILDHIDGDASNDFEYNLRLICPNCDSQLDTYKSKNKNSARSHRKNY